MNPSSTDLQFDSMLFKLKIISTILRCMHRVLHFVVSLRAWRANKAECTTVAVPSAQLKGNQNKIRYDEKISMRYNGSYIFRRMPKTLIIFNLESIKSERSILVTRISSKKFPRLICSLRALNMSFMHQNEYSNTNRNVNGMKQIEVEFSKRICNLLA